MESIESLSQERNSKETSNYPKNLSVRIAVYDTVTALPRIIDFECRDEREFIEKLSAQTYHYSQEKGGHIPFTVIREVVENLIHAYFSEPIVTIMNSGNIVKISDQGPGISNKDKAMEPGFTTANSEMKKIIRGVGSGIPVAKEMLIYSGGSIRIEDNLEKGTVITLSLPETGKESPQRKDFSSPLLRVSEVITERQKKILFLLMEIEKAGPSKISAELNIGISTAHRDLLYLEEKGLIKIAEGGKRSLASKGSKYLEGLIS